MDKVNTMKFNSIKGRADNYATRGNLMYSYNTNTKSILLEMFDFTSMKKHILVHKAGKECPDVLSMNTFDAMDLLISESNDETKWTTTDIQAV